MPESPEREGRGRFPKVLRAGRRSSPQPRDILEGPERGRGARGGAGDPPPSTVKDPCLHVPSACTGALRPRDGDPPPASPRLCLLQHLPGNDWDPSPGRLLPGSRGQKCHPQRPTRSSQPRPSALRTQPGRAGQASLCGPTRGRGRAGRCSGQPRRGSLQGHSQRWGDAEGQPGRAEPGIETEQPQTRGRLTLSGPRPRAAFIWASGGAGNCPGLCRGRDDLDPQPGLARPPPAPWTLGRPLPGTCGPWVLPTNCTDTPPRPLPPHGSGFSGLI